MDSQTRIKQLEQFLALDPRNPVLLRDLGLSYHETGEHERALELLERAREGLGEDPTLLNQIGSVELALGKWPEASVTLKRAIAKDPDAGPLHFNFAYARLADGDAKEAARHFRRAIDLKLTTARAYYLLALANEQGRDPQAARQALAELFRLEPDHEDGQVLAAQLDIEQGKLAEAERMLEKTTTAHPQAVEAWWLKAQLALLAMDAQKGERLFRHAVGLKPDHAESHIGLGQALLMQMKFKQAEAALRKGIALDPQASMAHVALGWCSVLEDRLAEADAQFRQALEIDPEVAEAYAGLALLRLAQQRSEEAERLAAQALAFDPACVTALMIQSQLAQARGDSPKAQELARRFLEGSAFGSLGWRNREVLERAQASPTVKHVTKKAMRVLRKRQGTAFTRH